jgi:hypothetical protein
VTVLPLTLLIALSSGAYVRTRTDTGQSNPKGPFLFWNQNAITFHQDTLGNPENAGDTEFTAISDSFATWQAQLDFCGSIKFFEGERTSRRRAVYSEDGLGQQNVVLFRHKTCAAVPQSDECWADIMCNNVYDCWGGEGYRPGTIALTTTTFDLNTGQILDADIELNSEAFVFTTVNAPKCSPPVVPVSQNCIASDIQNTMTHEVGHLLGLDHALDTNSTMYESAPLGEIDKRFLDSDSKQFICDVYPKNSTYPVASMDSAIGSAVGCSSVGALGSAISGLTILLGLALRRRRRRSE